MTAGDTSGRFVRFWAWRDDLHRRLAATREEDAAHRAAFVARAQELADEVAFVLGNGLTEGAVEALSALAEQDMVDFCIMVDLAAAVSIAGVTPLAPEVRRHLEEFLDNEPWHSLMVDNDLTVALAMVEAVAAAGAEVPWYETSPNLIRVTARVLDGANAEQVQRFVGELNALGEASGAPIPNDAAEILRYIVRGAAQRLGIEPPRLSA